IENNRHISQRTVEKYAAAMKAGQWVLNGESIKFDKDAKLIDGQHRLWACIESDVPFKTMVVYDAPTDAFMTIDSGRTRNAGDALAIAGFSEANEKRTAATARWCIIYMRQLKTGNAGFNEAVTTPEIVEYVDQNPRLIDFVKMVSANSPARRYGGPLIAVAYLGSHSHNELAKN